MVAEQVVVCRGVREFIPHRNRIERAENPRKHDTPARRDRDIFLFIPKILAHAVEAVIVVRHRLTEFIDASVRSVGMVMGLERNLGEPVGGTLDSADVRLSLAEVTPIGPPAPVAELRSVYHRLSDPHVGYGTECCLFLCH